MYASGGLFAYALDIVGNLLPIDMPTNSAEELDKLLVIFATVRIILGIELGVFVELYALVNEQSGIAAIVDNEVGAQTVAKVEGFSCAPPVLGKALALPSKNGDTSLGDGSRSMVLSREDVARAPTNLSTQSHESLNENGRLNGHMERACDAGSLKRLLTLVALAEGHKTRHLKLRNSYLVTTELGQVDVGHFIGIVVLVNVFEHGYMVLLFTLRKIGCAKVIIWMLKMVKYAPRQRAITIFKQKIFEDKEKGYSFVPSW